MKKLRKYKIISIIFTVLTILLSHLMCINITYNYVRLSFGGLYFGFSAPPSFSFILLIPYGIIIIVFALIAFVFWRKYKNGYVFKNGHHNLR